MIPTRASRSSILLFNSESGLVVDTGKVVIWKNFLRDFSMPAARLPPGRILKFSDFSVFFDGSVSFPEHTITEYFIGCSFSFPTIRSKGFGELSASQKVFKTNHSVVK